MSNPIYLAIVEINPSGDGYTVVAMNEKIVLQGDEYHDKVHDQFEGIKVALEYLDLPYKVETHEFDEDAEQWFDWDYQPDQDETLTEYLIKIRKQQLKGGEVKEEEQEVWLYNGGKAYYLHLYQNGRTWVVECKYGKRDNTLRTAQLASGAPFDVAYKIYAKRLKEKTNSGYEEE